MSRPWAGQGSQGQLAAVVLDIGDLLPVDDLTWSVLELVGELDLSRFEAAYRVDGQGRPPYEPAMMLALIVYCRARKMVSGRQIEDACRHDVGARVITGNRYPQRTAIDRFLRTHGAAIRALLAQTLRLGAQEGLVDVRVVAGDGTKMQANASMDATVEEGDLRAQISVLQEQVAALSARWVQQVGALTIEAGRRPRFGAYLFDEAHLAMSAHQRTSAVSGTGESGGEEGTRGGGECEVTWRKLTTTRGKLDARLAALAQLSAHPGRVLTDWQDALTRRQARVTQIEESMARTRADLEERAAARATAEAAGRKVPGTRPVRVEEHHRMRTHQQALHRARTHLTATLDNRPTTTRINTTDPDSAIMPGKHDGFGQRHNVQALACKNQFILAIGIHHSPNDKRAMIDLLNAARANLDAAGLPDPIGVALFDNGYASNTNFTADVPVHTLLIAIRRKPDPTTDTSDHHNNKNHNDNGNDNDENPPTTTITSSSGPSQSWQIMRERLDEPANRLHMKQRSALIEPLFAQLFTRFGRTLTHRGPHVDTELHLWALTHNLLKIHRHRTKTHHPRPPT